MMYQNSSGSKAQLLQKINEVSFAVNDPMGNGRRMQITYVEL